MKSGIHLPYYLHLHIWGPVSGHIGFLILMELLYGQKPHVFQWIMLTLDVNMLQVCEDLEEVFESESCVLDTVGQRDLFFYDQMEY